MAFLVDVQELLEVEVGVLLRRGQAGVAQELLDDPKIRAPAEEVRSEGVAERMGADLPADGRPPDVFLRRSVSTDREVSRPPL